MISIDGKEYRNLEEQVQKNKEDIAKHYQAMQLPLNLAGIEVIGSITAPSELDGVVGEKFGDAYVQVVGEDTILWIWTRANPNAGEDEAYWLDIPFTTVGEQGAPGSIGPQGPQGTRGSLWFTGKTHPGFNTPHRDGDMYLNSTDGSVYSFKTGTLGYSWEPAGNIQGPRGYTGPQGPEGKQGPKGERGPIGPQGPISPSVVIHAILNSVDELPAPTDLNNLSAAYVVNGNLYVQVGSKVSTAVWTNMGSFSGGTTVFKDGEPVTAWNANTKIDMPVRIQDYYSVDVAPVIERSYSGPRRVIPRPVLDRPEDGAIPYYNENGNLKSNEAYEDNDVIPLQQFGSLFRGLNSPKYGHVIEIPIYDDLGEIKHIAVFKYIDNIDISFIEYEDAPHEWTIDQFVEYIKYMPLPDTLGNSNCIIITSIIGAIGEYEVKLQGESDTYYIPVGDITTTENIVLYEP